MEGPPGDRGVNYRTLQQLFQTVEARRDETSFLISVSLLEVALIPSICRPSSISAHGIMLGTICHFTQPLMWLVRKLLYWNEQADQFDIINT